MKNFREILEFREKMTKALYDVLVEHPEGMTVTEIRNSSTYLQQFSIQKITSYLSYLILCIDGKTYTVDREVKRIENYKYPVALYKIGKELYYNK